LLLKLCGFAALREEIIQRNNRKTMPLAKAQRKASKNNITSLREKSSSAPDIQFVFMFLNLAAWREKNSYGELHQSFGQCGDFPARQHGYFLMDRITFKTGVDDPEVLKTKVF
jgi:hypothetical protein